MYCAQCGKQITDDSKFCQFCGNSTGEAKNENAGGEKSPSPSSTFTPQNYQPIFWKYFWLGAVLNVFSTIIESIEEGSAGDYSLVWIFVFVAIVVYVYKFSKLINEAMAEIGQANWWPLGLLALIPFGFWIAFFVVRAKLKPKGLWRSKDKSFRLTRK